MFGNLNIQEFRLADANFEARKINAFKLRQEQVFEKINEDKKL